MPDYLDIGRPRTPITTAKSFFREEFQGPTLDPNRWKVTQTGVGMSYSFSGGILTVTMGTTNGDELIFETIGSWDLPLKLGVLLRQSQRIANNEIRIQLVSDDGPTGADGEAAEWLLDGATNTTFKLDSRTRGVSTPGGGITYTGAGASTSTRLYQTELNLDRVDYRRYALTAGGGTTIPDVFTNKVRSIPDAGISYKFRIRFKNAGVPASSTTVDLDGVYLIDATTLSVSKGSNDIVGTASTYGDSILVYNQVNTFASSVNIRYDESTTPLSGSATFTGTGRDVHLTTSANVTSNFAGMTFYDASATSDVAGTLFVDVSNDNSTWRNSFATAACSAGGFATLSGPMPYRYCRVRYVNGAGAQTYFNCVLNTRKV